MMGRLLLGIILLLSFSCKNFDGLAGRSGESYTHTYNYPTSRIAPYNDPFLDWPEDPEKVNLCGGQLDSIQGFTCTP